eukprot:4607051-Amphidinium_carterae.1
MSEAVEMDVCSAWTNGPSCVACVLLHRGVFTVWPLSTAIDSLTKSIAGLAKNASPPQMLHMKEVGQCWSLLLLRQSLQLLAKRLRKIIAVPRSPECLQTHHVVYFMAG